MHPQLALVADELRAAQERLHRLAEIVSAEQWTRRTDPGRWSVSECVEHLNLTSRAYVPLLRAALEEARRVGGPAPERYRRDPLGWLLWRTMGPPVRVRLRTSAAFVPSTAASPADLVAVFDALQAEQLACVAAADGLPLTAVRVASPFDVRVRYNLYACLTMLPAHQRRHLWQAERSVSRGASGAGR